MTALKLHLRLLLILLAVAALSGDASVPSSSMLGSGRCS
jgi:hypothetical protein